MARFWVPVKVMMTLLLKVALCATVRAPLTAVVWPLRDSPTEVALVAPRLMAAVPAPALSILTLFAAPEFMVKDEEWYTYDRSPRANVHVLASVDEHTYSPDTTTKMGDHPVIWSNEHYKARNIYIFMGHRPELFQNPAFTAIFSNSIFWAAHQPRNSKGH